MLLRLFGATLGPDCHFYPASKVWAPWNLICADHVAAADGVEIYNPSPIHIHTHVILSQDCFLCGATHDYNHPDFPLIAFRMTIERYAWICARASVAPGVRVAEGAVLGLGSRRDPRPGSLDGLLGQPRRRHQTPGPHHPSRTVTLGYFPIPLLPTPYSLLPTPYSLQHDLCPHSHAQRRTGPSRLPRLCRVVR